MIVKVKYYVLLSTTLIFCWSALKAQPAAGKKEVTIQLAFLKKDDLSKQIFGKVLSRNDQGKTVPVKNLPVDFYLTDQQAVFTTVITDQSGKFYVGLPPVVPADTGDYSGITARVHGQNLYEDAVESLQWKEADIRMDYLTTDTTRTLKVYVSEKKNSGILVPLKEIPVSFFTQRMFGNVPAAEEYTVNTDETGLASFVYPKNIPGDGKGNIVLVTSIVNDEVFGTVEKKATAQWGTVLLPEKDPFPRALWEPRAPLQLIITISLLFGGVWIIYFFIFSQMYRIKHQKKESITAVL